MNYCQFDDCYEVALYDLCNKCIKTKFTLVSKKYPILDKQECLNNNCWQTTLNAFYYFYTNGKKPNKKFIFNKEEKFVLANFELDWNTHMQVDKPNAKYPGIVHYQDHYYVVIGIGKEDLLLQTWCNQKPLFSKIAKTHDVYYLKERFQLTDTEECIGSGNDIPDEEY